MHIFRHLPVDSNLWQMSKRNIILFQVFLLLYLFYPELKPLFFKLDVDPSYFVTLPINIFFHLLVFFLFYFFFVPYLLSNRFNLFNAFGVLGILLAFTALRLSIFYYFNRYFLALPQNELVFTAKQISNEFRVSLVLSLYAFWTRFAIDWVNHQKLKADLIHQNQASELALLRTQINPHFLFNTLNNIYSLVMNRSEKAPKAVMKLSSIMRYMLFDSNSEKVMLEKEIDYLTGYIELQRLRLKDPEFIEFNINGNCAGHVIAPMLLVPFVENAFKHGNKNVSSPGIKVGIISQPGKITFEVMNHFNPNRNFEKDKVGGIGLSNIKRRLELIYPKKHRLEILSDNNEFRIRLELYS